MALRILSPIDGEIMSHVHGRETDDGLEIVVSGEASGSAHVTVNGEPATITGCQFETTLVLKERETTIAAQDDTGESESVVVLYDRRSFKRYRFSLDDNIWFLRDIYRGDCRSIFDSPYMAMWRELNRNYGTKVHINIYYWTPGFDLSMLSDRYKSEWCDNAEWLRLTFHAFRDQPGKPYLTAPYSHMAHDFDLVTNEIARIAGEELLSPFTTVHWGEATLDGCRALRDRGIVGLSGGFRPDNNGQRAVGYYLNEDEPIFSHIRERGYWKDTKADILHDMLEVCANKRTLAEIVPWLEEVASLPEHSDVVSVIIHEQYFYPEFRAHLPDYKQRCETAIRWLTERDYRPVFYDDGLFGNTNA